MCYIVQYIIDYTLQWNKFLELGKGMEDSVIDKIIDKQQPHQCAMLVYTVSNYYSKYGIMVYPITVRNYWYS